MRLVSRLVLTAHYLLGGVDEHRGHVLSGVHARHLRGDLALVEGVCRLVERLYHIQNVLTTLLVLYQSLYNVFVFDFDVDGLVEHVFEVGDLFLLHADQVGLVEFVFLELLDFVFLFEYVVAVLLPLSLHLSAPIVHNLVLHPHVLIVSLQLIYLVPVLCIFQTELMHQLLQVLVLQHDLFLLHAHVLLIRFLHDDVTPIVRLLCWLRLHS